MSFYKSGWLLIEIIQMIILVCSWLRRVGNAWQGVSIYFMILCSCEVKLFAKIILISYGILECYPTDWNQVKQRKFEVLDKQDIMQVMVRKYDFYLSISFLSVDDKIWFLLFVNVKIWFSDVNVMLWLVQGLLNVLAAPNTTDEGKMFMEGLQVSEQWTPIW